MIKTALHYKNNLGLNVLPMKVTYNEAKTKERGKLSYDKMPLVPWTELMTRKVTDEEIAKWWTQYPDAGIGAVMGSISNGIIAVDCDSEKAVEEMEASLSDSISIPCSKSISGSRHYFFSTDEVYNKMGRFCGDCDLQAENSLITLPPTRGKNGDCYSWINEPLTAKDFPALHASFQASTINNIYNKELTIYRGIVSLRSSNTQDKELTKLTKLTTLTRENIWESGIRDENLYHVALNLRRGGDSKDYIFQTLRAIILSWGEVDDGWINAKIKSVMGKEEKEKRHIHQEIIEYIETQKYLQEPYIQLTDLLQNLQILQKPDKNSAYVSLKRLCDERKYIEKQIDKRGVYRIIYHNLETKMDLLNEEAEVEFKMDLPLNLGNRVVISPGNICVIAGSKSSGKTAMLLNIAYLNQNKYEIVYLNSEMHATELKKRLKKFAPLNDWKITGHKCSGNFADFIEPDKKKIYIVDYLEVHDKFYEIAAPIKLIHEKLGDSVCFIGLQMKSGATLGRGGDFSAEKARLYLTMDYREDERRTMVTIYDAKEPRPPHDNVRGQSRAVKILNGCELFPEDTDWEWKKTIKYGGKV
jgi:hypothetical protein